MTSTVATEIPQQAESPKAPLETWGRNERMRHIPPIEWIARKVDGDLRRRIDILCSTFSALPASDPNRAAAEADLAALCRALDRLADVAKHTRPGNSHNPTDVTFRIRDAMHHAVTNLNGVDENLFGRRQPFHTFERSKAEPLVAGLVVVINALNRATVTLRKSDPSLDERLLDGLVTLQEPLRLQPIA